MTPPPKGSALPTVVLRGHLTEDGLRAVLAALPLGGERGPVLVDCREMTGYDLAARHAFVDWSRAHAGEVTRIAIVTSNRLWWMVIRAMSLASGRDMKGFETIADARAWAVGP